MASSISSSPLNPNTPMPAADTSWRRRRRVQVDALPSSSETSPPPSPPPLALSPATTSPHTFKIEWPAPEKEKIQNAASVALPTFGASTTPANPLCIERFKEINRQDPLIKRMDDSERRRHFPQAIAEGAHKRNRYPDVLPTPLDIVTLAHPTNPETAYINANKFHDMIITQGPVKNFNVDTVADFWTMAFEQGKDIVCLTDHMGLTRDRDLVEKTFPYWQSSHPSNPVVFKKQMGSDELEVKLIEGPSTALTSKMNTTELVTKRVFQISLNGQVKQVKHWHFENWKDNCVCDHMLLTRLIDRIHQEASSEGNPSVVVHCSAGIGRSGVFALAKHFIDRYRTTNNWPTEQEIDAAVLELRKRRPGSIQNAEQLELIQKALGAFTKIGYMSQSA